MSRRLDAGFLAGLVAEHRLDEDEALDSLDRPGRRPAAKGVQAVSTSIGGCRAGAAVPGGRRRRPAAPVRIVHLGLGNFFRAHQAWYTDLAPDAAEWGIAAFTGRSAHLADALTPQDGLYTLIIRGPAGDTSRGRRRAFRGPTRRRTTAAWLRLPGRARGA